MNHGLFLFSLPTAQESGIHLKIVGSLLGQEKGKTGRKQMSVMPGWFTHLMRNQFPIMSGPSQVAASQMPHRK